MKNIISIAIYRDGGTKLIETDRGLYWISLDKKVFKGDGYFQGKSELVTDQSEIIELLDKLCYSSERFFYIQRACK